MNSFTECAFTPSLIVSAKPLFELLISNPGPNNHSIPTAPFVMAGRMIAPWPRLGAFQESLN
jgi:hypothetical protein